MELEGHMVVSLACEIFDFEDDFILLSAGFLSRCDGCDRAADHGVDQFVAVGLAYIECADIFAVTHDRSPVADLENFFKSVADIHDRDAIFFQFLNYFEKCFGLFLGEGSGRLIKRDDGRLVIQRSGDGQHLHLSGCESSGNVLSFEVAVEIFQYLIDVRIHFSVVNKSALQRFIAESDVLADGQVLNDQRLLVYFRNLAFHDCLVRILEMNFFAVQHDFAFVFRIHAMEDIEKS